MGWFYNLLFLWIFIGLCTFIYLIFSKTIAPYGRHSNSKWGITIDNRWGWFWMELPALVLMPVIILFSPVEKNGIIILIIGLWTIIITFIILKFINMFMDLRVSNEAEEEGLDIYEHNEQGYNL